MSKKKADYWIKHLGLQTHPEGGYFKEVYRSQEQFDGEALPERYNGVRNVSTSIYFLLTEDSVSNFHRLNSDEIWHFHYGGTAKIHFVKPNGEYEEKLIGDDLNAGESFQVMIPKHTWFAAEVIREDYVLFGCTVAPGFEFEDFELADRQTLSSAYPQYQTLIARFTRN
jgi:predicted cupin superfamily sugar epimerase